ncbi:ABC transporter permease [Streptomyces sp. NPDC012461]|jgi:ABC-2 type transport system permease protein|uniref:ABC transporter permease subunit n=2 Tax=unclassified Streptomyces TaxID=2593676 RepID=A0A6G3R3F4_9ACTN|nr:MULTISPECIES: ABC transporter permease [unclassified Streptomyces]MBM7091826.1 ABC transporter permease [Streptomyces sp. S12]NEA90135.1 ABC transporter permease subunit [Streptomyces sp. SID14436]NEC26099.1 ABC transporter permease subunit [Streptomyces sp. SID8111]NEC83859.1 ABC transporter permease subunit [Streptomyces sp. SID7958]NED22332.1 ABC transporter permease subunit [Streptomyces sp. SID9913]
MAAGQVVRSEWTKIRSVASTVWTLSLAVVVTIALGMLISALSKSEFDNLSERDRLAFDPTFISFAGMGLGQLAMIVFGVLVVSNEYSTGMIRTSLAAVPQRATFLFSKLGVATALALVVGMATSFATFFLGQAMLGEHKASIGDEGVLRAVIGGGLYMTLIALFSMGVAAMLRSPMLSLGILMPFFFLISNILGNVDATKKVGQYLPDQAGSKILQVVPPLDDDTPYGPWGGLGIMALWVLAAVLGGYAVLKKRDA